MIRSLFLTTVLASSSWAAATYNFTSSNYSTVTPYSSCAAGPCANYATTMKITGSFTVATALGSNFSGATDITSTVTAFSFSDGITTYTSTDPNVRIYQFNVATDSSGNISTASILAERWQTGSSPHSVGDRVTLVNLNGPSLNQADNDLRCVTVGGGTGSGVADLCVLGNPDTSTSTASAATGSWTSPVSSPSPIPGTPAPTTLLLILTGLMATGLFQAMRKPATPAEFRKVKHRIP